MTNASRLAIVPLGLMLCATSAAAQQPLTIQDPASAQPTLPKPMPDLSIPAAGSGKAASKKHTSHDAARHVARRRHQEYARGGDETLERPVLANVELLERLPHPPQPPHVNVPVPAYPLENFVTYFTAPPPPVVCKPTRHERFKPEFGLVDEKPVLCTADNP